MLERQRIVLDGVETSNYGIQREECVERADDNGID